MSGCGKSSLVRAGVLPVLTQPGVVEGVDLWRRCVFRPSDSESDPLEALAHALVSADALPELDELKFPASLLTEHLRRAPVGADGPVRMALAHAAESEQTRYNLPRVPESRLAVVVDQLEEIFTRPNLCASDREKFLTALATLARSGIACVVATMRSDFYARCAELPELVALKAGLGQYDLLPPTFGEIGRMIRHPASAAGLSFEEDTETGRRLDEAVHETAFKNPEALPLLEFTLDMLYGHRTEAGLLTWSAYRELGGLEGAIGHYAESVFEALDPAVKPELSTVLRALVTVGTSEGEPVVARRALRATVAATPARVALLDALIKARLVVTDSSPDGTPTVSLAHESLLRQWQRLSAWVAMNREHLRLLARIEHAERRWEQVQNDPSLLLPAGLPLAEGRTLLLAATDLLRNETVRFIQASVAHHQSADSRRARVRRSVISSLSVLLSLTIVLTAAAVLQHRSAVAIAREKAKTEGALEEIKRLSALSILDDGVALSEEGDGGRGVLLMARSLAMCPESEQALQRRVRTSLASATASLHVLESVLSFPDPTTAVAFNPDGKTLLVVGAECVYLVNVATGEPVASLRVSARSVSSVAFSPDGKRLATSSEDGTVRIADASDGRDLGPPITFGHVAKSIAFSPDGKTVVVAGPSDVSLRCYDVATNEPARPAFACRDENLYMAVYSPDGRLIATAAKENNAAIWDAATGERIGRPLPHPGVVFSVAFSPDCRTVVTGCLDGGVRLWDVKSGKQIDPVLRHKGAVRSTNFSRDGRLLLTSSEDGTARLWQVATGRPFGQVLSHPSELRQALFSPDQAYALTAGYERTARLWRLAREQSVAKVLQHSSNVAEIAFGPGGDKVLTGCQGSAETPGAARLWDAKTGMPLGLPMSQQGQVMTIAFSPDGKLAITGGNDGTARLWNTADSSPAQPPWKYGNVVAATAFSPDGRLVAMAGRGNKVQLRELPSGREVAVWPPSDPEAHWIWSLAFTTDGQMLLSGGGEVSRLRAVSDGRTVGQLMKHNSNIRATLLSPDGQTVLTCSYDKTARLWSARDGKPLSPPLLHKGDVRGGAFRHDSKVVATVSADATARLWEVPSGRSLLTPLFHRGWVRSVAFSPDGKTLVTGCDDGTARLWSADDGSPLGAVLRHYGPVNRVAYSLDGKTVLTASNDGTARLWEPQPPVLGDATSLALWVQVLTGMELDPEEGTVQVLSSETWHHRSEQLRASGVQMRPGTR